MTTCMAIFETALDNIIAQGHALVEKQCQPLSCSEKKHATHGHGLCCSCLPLFPTRIHS